MKLWEVADFVRSRRRQMRFGKLSRAALRLLRLEPREDAMECGWMTRSPRSIAPCCGRFVNPRASRPR
jgi:hypothetical protein